jgi:hypothetical protein
MIAGSKTKLKGSYGLARDGSGITTYRAAGKGNARPIGVLKGKARCTNPSASRFSELAIPSR